jgi:hypothetical protein
MMAFCSNCGAKIEEGVEFCSSCGKPINSLPNESVAPLSQDQSAEVSKKLNTMALIGFLLGLISLFLLSFFGIVGIVACVCSGIGLGEFNSATENNKWMAVLGILLGIFSIILTVIIHLFLHL